MPLTPHIMKIDGIPGESREPNWREWINIESFSWGIHNQVSTKGTARAAGMPEFSEFTITKPTDKTSPKLFMYCATGQQIPELKVVFRRMGKSTVAGQPSALEPYYEWVFNDVIVGNYQNGGADQVAASESVSFSCSKAQMTYFVMKQGQRTDNVMAKYDMRKKTDAG